MRGLHIFVACLLSAQTLAACGGSKNQWEDIDYSSVYRRAGQRENDPGYRQPSVSGCVDDDLYNCR